MSEQEKSKGSVWTFQNTRSKKFSGKPGIYSSTQNKQSLGIVKEIF